MGEGQEQRPLRERMLVLAAVLEQSDLGQILLGPGGRVVLWNAWMERASGVSRERAQGSTLTEIFPQLRGDRVVAAVAAALERGMSSLLARSMSRSPLPLRTVPGSRDPGVRMDQTVTAKPISIDGLPRHCLLQIFDITAAVGREQMLRTQAKELRRVAQELAGRNEELSEFMFVAHHALKTPLRSIAVYSQLLEAQCKIQLGEEGAGHLWVIQDAALRLRELIDDVIEFWKAGRRDEPLAPVRCDQVLNDVLAEFAGEIREAEARVGWDSLPVVRATYADLRQIFGRLIENALRFRSSRAPEIRVRAEAKEHEWCFAVQDNGIGFEPRYAEQVFRLFQRLHPLGRHSETGVGLAIVRRIAERLGGRVWAESEPGRGTTVYFTLPREDEEEDEDD